MQVIPVSSSPEVGVQIEPVQSVKAVTKAVQAAEPEAKHVDSQEIAKLETALAQHDISLKFSQDETTNRVVVQMIDGRTGEAIRQFPTEVSLSLAANFMKLQGVFLDEEK